MTSPPVTAHDHGGAIKDAYVRRCRLLRVVDGDTQHLLIDYGYRMRGEHAIRLLGVDCPEIYSGTREEKARGQAAKQFAMDWYRQQSHDVNPEWPFWIASEKADSFGRWLGDVYSARGEHLAAALLDAGHAVPWAKP